MLAIRLRAVARQGPSFLREIELRPAHRRALVAALAGDEHRHDGAPKRALPLARGPQGADLGDRQAAGSRLVLAHRLLHGRGRRGVELAALDGEREERLDVGEQPVRGDRRAAVVQAIDDVDHVLAGDAGDGRPPHAGSIHRRATAATSSPVRSLAR